MERKLTREEALKWAKQVLIERGFILSSVLTYEQYFRPGESFKKIRFNQAGHFMDFYMEEADDRWNPFVEQIIAEDKAKKLEERKFWDKDSPGQAERFQLIRRCDAPDTEAKIQEWCAAFCEVYDHF